jgi:hypothetical protein
MTELKIGAKNKENRIYLREQNLKQYSNYAIQPYQSRLIWDGLRARINDEANGLDNFCDIFLFINAKNMKMEYKYNGSLFNAIE